MKRFIFVLLFIPTLCWTMDQPDSKAGQLTLRQIREFDTEDPPDRKTLIIAMRTLAEETQQQELRIITTERTNRRQNCCLFVTSTVITVVSLGFTIFWQN